MISAAGAVNLFPFVVTLAAAVGGVGKTLLAVNLAICLKALREDLPVTFASFDPNFHCEQFFAIHGRSASDCGELLRPRGGPAQLGQYGVNFLASRAERTLGGNDPLRLRRALASPARPGVVILDTAGLDNEMTRNALAAADLVLVPVCDQASLVATAAVARLLRSFDGESDRLWVLLNRVEQHRELRPGVNLLAYLRQGAMERGYQLIPASIAPIAGLNGVVTLLSRDSAEVQTALGELASAVLACYDGSHAFLSEQQSRRVTLEPLGRARRQRLLESCPLCGEPSAPLLAWLAEDAGRRRQALLHHSCLRALCAEAGVAELLPDYGMVLVRKPEPGWSAQGQIRLALWTGAEPVPEIVEPRDAQVFARLLEAVSGCAAEELPGLALRLWREERGAAGLLAWPGLRHARRRARMAARQLQEI